VLQRTYVDELALSAQYPFNQTQRFEIGASGTRLAWDQQVDSVILDLFNNPQAYGRRTSGGPPPVMYAQGQLALVGDNSFAAFTSPITGSRYRLEVGPVFGNVVFNTALADGRKYFFKRPVTLAFRGVHYGRYGRDADNYDRLSPLYLGEETLIRGYGYGSFTLDECSNSSTGPSGSCPVFDRLLGSKLGVFNAELRIPVFGTSSFGLLNFPYLPLEVSPFFDAGLAWSNGQNPDLRFTSNDTSVPANCAGQTTQQGFTIPCADRIPVFSTGVSFRFNVLGYMILETYVAHPFQRPSKKWVVGIQLAPGW
jgi:outer membrane protein assembly factor BamA